PPCRARQPKPRAGCLDTAAVPGHDAITSPWNAPDEGSTSIMSGTAVCEEAGPTGAWSQDPAASGLGRWPLLVLSAWCGLVSGLLEVGLTVLRKRTLDSNHLYWMSRHFLWLVPLANLLIFLSLGVVIGLAIPWGGRRGRWLAPRLLCALAWLPPLWA